MDARGAPERIRCDHSTNQALDLGIEGRATSGWAAGEPSPVLAEAVALPAQDSVGRDDDQSLSPSGPDSGQPDPQQAIRRPELRAAYRSLVNGELLAQGEILERDVSVAADKEGKEPEQVKHERDHKSRLLPDRAEGSTT